MSRAVVVTAVDVDDPLPPQLTTRIAIPAHGHERVQHSAHRARADDDDLLRHGDSLHTRPRPGRPCDQRRCPKRRDRQTLASAASPSLIALPVRSDGPNRAEGRTAAQPATAGDADPSMQRRSRPAGNGRRPEGRSRIFAVKRRDTFCTHLSFTPVYQLSRPTRREAGTAPHVSRARCAVAPAHSIGGVTRSLPAACAIETVDPYR